MVCACIHESVRRQLIVLARRPNRIVPRTIEMPCRWRPGQVNNPECGLPFTESGAWHFIADLLERGHHVETLPMERPPDTIGYVLKVKIETERPPLYIKIQLAATRVIGRSFHYSEIPPRVVLCRNP
jgi:hypothetical protein